MGKGLKKKELEKRLFERDLHIAQVENELELADAIIEQQRETIDDWRDLATEAGDCALMEYDAKGRWKRAWNLAMERIDAATDALEVPSPMRQDESDDDAFEPPIYVPSDASDYVWRRGNYGGSE